MSVEQKVITFDAVIPGRDHIVARVNGRRIGFRPIDSEKVCVERCDVCGRENYALAVMSGCCCWCGWDANK